MQTAWMPPNPAHLTVAHQIHFEHAHVRNDAAVALVDKGCRDVLPAPSERLGTASHAGETREPGLQQVEDAVAEGRVLRVASAVGEVNHAL